MKTRLPENLTKKATEVIRDFHQTFSQWSPVDELIPCDCLGIIYDNRVRTAIVGMGFWDSSVQARLKWYIERTQAKGWMLARIGLVESASTERPALFHVLQDLSDHSATVGISLQTWEGGKLRHSGEKVPIEAGDEARKLIQEMQIAPLVNRTRLSPEDPETEARLLDEYLTLCEGESGLVYSMGHRH